MGERSPQIRIANPVGALRRVEPRPEAVERSDAVFLAGICPGVLTGRIGLNSPETDHVFPAVEARHDGYDIDCIHVIPNSRAAY